jgi:hypothetical protein
MSPSPKPPANWPDRPKGFFEDWTVFCIEALAKLLKEQDDMLAAVLLAGGAVLGAGGIFALVQANREVIDAKGKEWGIESLGSIALGGGTLLGAAVGTLGGALLNRTLGRHTDRAKVDALQSRLTRARREFEMLRQDAKSGLLDSMQHRLAVERLFLELTQPPT